MELYALFFVIGLLVVLYLINLSRARRAKEALGHVIADLSRDLDALRVRNHELTAENESLVPFRDVQDAAAEAARLRAGAVGDVAAAI